MINLERLICSSEEISAFVESCKSLECFSFSLWEGGFSLHQFSAADIKGILKCQIDSLGRFRLGLDESSESELGLLYLGPMTEFKKLEIFGEPSVSSTIRLQDALRSSSKYLILDGLAVI